MVARLVALTAILAVSGALALLVRRPGRSRAVTAPALLGPADLGSPLGTTATYVQFSTPTCAPCRAVRRALTEIVSARPDLVHVDLDAERHLDLVRRHRVLTTPTVLVLDARGRARHRFTGPTRRDALEQALDDLGRSATGDPAITAKDTEDARA